MHPAISFLFYLFISGIILTLFLKNSLGEVSQNDSNEVVRQLTSETKSFYSANFDENKYLQQSSSDRVQKFVKFYEGLKRQKSRASNWLKKKFRSGDKDEEKVRGIKIKSKTMIKLE